MLKKAHTPTLPQARQDAPLPGLRSRLVTVLNVASREKARLGALGAGGCNRLRLRRSLHLRPCWMAFLNILYGVFRLGL